MDPFTATTSPAPEEAGTSVVAVSGSMTIEYGQSIKKVLLQALEEAEAESSATVVLDLEGVCAIDLTGLQFVCSLHRSASAQGAQLRLVGSTSELMTRVKEAAGYQAASRCSSTPEHGCILCNDRPRQAQEVA